MSVEATRQLIVSELDTAWGAGPHSATKIVYENQEIPTTGTYIYFRINHGEGGKAEIVTGSAYHRFEGYIQADVLVPPNTGVGSAGTLADYFAGIFRGKELSSLEAGYLTFRTENIRNFGDSNGYYRLMVRIPFKRDTRY